MAWIRSGMSSDTENGAPVVCLEWLIPVAPCAGVASRGVSRASTLNSTPQGSVVLPRASSIVLQSFPGS